MNSSKVERFLAQVSDNQQPSFPDTDDKKVCSVLKKCELDGRPCEPNDTLELDARQAKQLQIAGKLVVYGGGRCDRLRIGKYLVSGFRPWDEPQAGRKTTSLAIR